MKKKYLLLIILLIFNIRSFSQKHNIKVNLGLLHSNIITFDDFFVERKNNQKILYGIGYEYKIKKFLATQISVNYLKLGFNDYFVYTNENGVEYKRDIMPYNFNYVSFLIGANFAYGKKIEPYLSIGISPSFLISANYYYPDEIAKKIGIERKVNLKNKINNLEFGIYSNIGVKYNFSRLSFFLEALLYRSITTYTNKDYLPKYKFYNYYYAINSGIIYRINKSSR